MRIHWLCLSTMACLFAAGLCTALVAQQAAVAGASGEPLRLDDAIATALERSPEVAGAEATIHAMQLRVPQARALPDPVVSAGWAGKLAPFVTMPGDPSSYRGITVSEQFPYPGKLRLQGEVAAHEVDAAHADCEAARRRIVRDVKIAYAEYFYLDKAIAATRQNKELLEKLASIAESQYRIGKAMQADVLRAQVEVSMLIEKLAMLEEQRDETVTELNAALYQPLDQKLPPPEGLRAEPIQPSLDELYAKAETNATDLERDSAMIARGKASVALAERQLRPDFGVSYMLQQRTDQATMNGVTVSVNLPLFRKTKQNAAIAEAAESLHSAEKMQLSRKNMTRAEVRKQYLAAETSERLLALYTKGIVPQSSLALESAMSEYQVGKVDFLSLVASFSTLLTYETESYRQIADHQIAVAAIESLTGEPITADSYAAAHAANNGKGAR